MDAACGMLNISNASTRSRFHQHGRTSGYAVSPTGTYKRLRFRGKSGLKREAVVEDKRLVRLLKQLKGLRGAHVFQFIDEAGQIHPVDSIAVNEYLDERSGHHFTAKDFCTWKASAVAAGLLYREAPVKKVFAAVAEALGNTPTVCRKYYVHPGLIDGYLEQISFFRSR